MSLQGLKFRVTPGMWRLDRRDSSSPLERSVGTCMLHPQPAYQMTQAPGAHASHPHPSPPPTSALSPLSSSIHHLEAFQEVWFCSILVSSPHNHKPLWDFRMWLIRGLFCFCFCFFELSVIVFSWKCWFPSKMTFWVFHSSSYTWFPFVQLPDNQKIMRRMGRHGKPSRKLTGARSKSLRALCMCLKLSTNIPCMAMCSGTKIAWT